MVDWPVHLFGNLQELPRTTCRDLATLFDKVAALMECSQCGQSVVDVKNCDSCLLIGIISIRHEHDKSVDSSYLMSPVSFSDEIVHTRLRPARSVRSSAAEPQHGHLWLATLIQLEPSHALLQPLIAFTS
jgi:hypothetical protein